MKHAILLVEDDQTILNLYQRIFQKHSPVSLLVAKNKADGLALALKHQPKLMLLDLIIPEREGEVVAYDRRVGFDLLREIRRQPAIREITVFVFSNIDTHEDRLTSAELGVTEYLVKAEYTPASVVEKVQEHLVF